MDTGFSSLPLVAALEARNIRIHVVGVRATEGIINRAFKYHELDYSDTGELASLIKNIRPNYLIPGCTDLSYLSCALVSEAFGFPGFDNMRCVKNIQDKSLLRKNMTAVGLTVPKEIINLDGRIDFPIIIKPVDSFSGNGITVIDANDTELIAAAQDKAKSFSASGSILMEDYVLGQLVSHSAFIVDNHVKHDFLVNEYCTATNFTVDTSYVARDDHIDIHKSLRCKIQKLIEQLGLVDGLLHTQFIKTNDDFYILEATRRCPGDLYSQLITLSSGFDYAAAYLDPFTNGEVSPDWSARDKGRRIMRHTVSSNQPHSYFGVEFLRPVEIVSWVPTAKTGDILAGGSPGRSAVFFAETSSKKRLKLLVDQTISRNLYNLPALSSDRNPSTLYPHNTHTSGRLKLKQDHEKTKQKHNFRNGINKSDKTLNRYFGAST